MTTVKLGGKEREVKYPFEAVRRISKELDKSIPEVLSGGFSLGNVDTMITLIWGGLLHNARNLTSEMVSGWLDESDNYPEVAATCAGEYIDSVRRKLHLVAEPEETAGDDGPEAEEETKN